MFATVPGSSVNSWDSWFIFNLWKINTRYYTRLTCTWIGTTINSVEGGGEIIYVQQTVYILNIPSQQVCLCRGWGHLFTIMHIYQTMYILGLGLLEAPREYVLHGPLLGIYWLRLCPHFWEPALEATLDRRRLFIVLMTAGHISPTSFPSKRSSPTYSEKLIIIHIVARIHIYTSHSYVHSHPCITLNNTFMHISHLHFFCSSWQAGCSRLIVSDTLKINKCLIHSPFVLQELSSLIHFTCIMLWSVIIL
jgi:hypothetical protein